MTDKNLPPAAPPRVIGHRGAAGHAPENTLAGFAKAATLGARWVEFDVRLTRDGRPVVFHDDTLERTTAGKGRVSDIDLTQIKKLDAGRWYADAFAGERVPALEDALDALGKLGLGANIELKSDSDPAREAETGRVVAKALRASWPKALPAPLVSSFRLPALKAAGETAPEFPRALLLIEIDADWRRKADDLGCVAVHCREAELTQAQARQVLEKGYGLRCFTVNEKKRALTLFSWGVESVFSDYPDRLLAK